MTEFVRRHEKKLWKYLKARPIPHSVDIDDLLQETWLAFYEHLQGGRSTIECDENAHKYLYRIAHGIREDCWRKVFCNKRQKEYSALTIGDGGVPHHSPALGVEDFSFNQIDTLDELHQLSTFVDPEEWELLLLPHQGYSYQEIADRVPGSTPEGIRKKLSRTTQQLHEYSVTKYAA